MNHDEVGCGCPKTLTAALFLAVGAVGPPAAARPRESGQSYAATGCGVMAPWGLLVWTHSGWSSSPLKAHLVWVTGAPGVEVLCDLIPSSQRQEGQHTSVFKSALAHDPNIIQILAFN